METPPTASPVARRAAVFSPPRLRRAAIRRHRLNRRLDDGLDGAVTVVSGPAGYGKSTLAADWLDQLELPATWLSLDRSHRDPRVLVRDLAGAVRAAFPAALTQFARRLETARGETDAPLLVREYSVAVERDVEDLFVFVIDDVHVLAGSRSIDALDTLVHHPPPNVRLVLLTRAWDALPELARLVTADAAVALLEGDLAFNDAEAARLLRRNRLRDRETIRALTRRAGGWPAALALLAEHHTTGPEGAADATGAFVLSDYLDREVLGRLTPAQLAMLEVCAVLERFEPDVLHEIAGGRRGATMLRRLELHTQLIVRAADAASYRIHGLLAEHLIARLLRDAPDRLRALRRAARAAYERRGDLRRALAFALDAEDWSQAASGIAAIRDELYQHGDWAHLADSIDRLPDALVSASPDLALTRARVAIRLNDSGSALRLLEQVDMSNLSRESRAAHYLCQASALRHLGRIQESSKAGTLARPELKPSPMPPDLLGEFDLQMGLTLAVAGRFLEARPHLERATSTFQRAMNLRGEADALDALGSTFGNLGRYAEAAAAYSAALRVCTTLHDVPQQIILRLNQAYLDYVSGDVSTAQASLSETHKEAQTYGLKRAEAYSQLNLAIIDIDAGIMPSAVSRLNRALELSGAMDDALLRMASMFHLSRAYLELQQIGRASDIMSSGLKLAKRAESLRYVAEFSSELGLLAIEHKQVSEGQTLLNSALLGANRSNSPVIEASILLRVAAAFSSRGYVDHVLRYLRRYLTIVSALPHDQPLRADRRRLAHYFRRHATGSLSAVISEVWAEDIRRVRGSAKEQSETRDAHPRRRGETRSALGQRDIETKALGTPIVVVDHTTIRRADWRSERSLEMYFLLVETGRAASKAEISLAIWPDVDPRRLNSAFHSTLYRARQAIGQELIRFDGDAYSLDSSCYVNYDTALFRQLIVDAATGSVAKRTRLLDEAVATYGGAFLSGVESDWVHAARSELALKYSGALTELATLALKTKGWSTAVDYASRALAVDPLNEIAVEAAIRGFLEAGTPGLATQIFREFLITTESHEVRPSARLRQLYDSLLTGFTPLRTTP